MNSNNVLVSLTEPRYQPELNCFRKEVLLFFLGQELARAERYSSFVSFALFRIDGESALRSALTKVASSLGKNIRRTDYLGQYDGRTLAVILLNSKVENTARVSQRLVEEILVHTRDEYPDVQIGVASAVFPTEANSFETIRQLVLSRLENREQGEPFFS
ncbi:MAG TPA: diguanylate cyclase [Acidobacteriota bacterium]|nr:diguanylate cyclase [Acidobacteriota bacterium]